MEDVRGAKVKQYGKIARSVGKLLEPFPIFRTVLRHAYRYCNYHLYRDRNFICSLHPQVKLFSAYEWATGGRKVDSVGEYFFGYYDKTPWSADMQQAVFHCIRDDGCIEITLFNRNRQQVRVIGRSAAYNLQQGSMTQWLPAVAGKKVIYNCYIGGCLGSVIVDTETIKEQYPSLCRVCIRTGKVH